MKTKTYNYDKIKKKEINDQVIRVKALMMNSKKEILLVNSFHTFQFPGGHLEANETVNEALKREILEETGIKLKEDYKPFYKIQYYLKDFPVIGHNRSIEIYYFIILTDEVYHLENIYLDDQERNGDFKLSYISLKKVKKVLNKTRKLQPFNQILVREMLLALKNSKKSGVL